MLAFDFDRAVRWARPERWKTFARRKDDALPFLTAAVEAGPALLLDTCVYVDRMHGSIPPVVQELSSVRTVHHPAVAITELMHLVGRLDPRDKRSADAISRIRSTVRGMPAHRVVSPDVDMLGRAAILSGILCRVQGYAADDRVRAFNDCVLFVQSQKLGLTLLTRNTVDFDILLQMFPAGRILLYRQERAARQV